MANQILINYVASVIGLAWPGTIMDDTEPTYTRLVSAGGIFWPATDPIVAARANFVTQSHTAGLMDLQTAQSMMFAGVQSSLSEFDTSISSVQLAARTAGQVSGGSPKSYVIDPLLGSDLSADGPFQTLKGFFRRINGVLIDTLVTVTVKGNVLANDSPAAVLNTGPSGFFVLQPDPAAISTIVSGTFTSVTACVPSTNTPDAITDTALSSNSFWTTVISQTAATGKRIRRISDGVIFWPAKDLGTKQARVSCPMITNYTAGVFSASNAKRTLTVGEAYVVEQLPMLQGLTLMCNSDRSNGGVNSGQARVVIKDLALTKRSRISSQDPGYRADNNVAMWNCDLGEVVTAGSVLSFNCRHNTLYMDGFQPFLLAGLLSFSTVTPLYVGRGCSRPFIDQRCMVQGPSGGNIAMIVDCGGGNGGSFGSIQIYDATDAILATYGTAMRLASGLGSTEIFGSGNTGFGLRLRGGALPSRTSGGTFALGTAESRQVVLGSGTSKLWSDLPFTESTGIIIDGVSN